SKVNDLGKMVEEKLPNGDSDPQELLKVAVKDGRVDILMSMLQQLGELSFFVKENPEPIGNSWNQVPDPEIL
ncbi:hypothetical protein FO519_010683, partial [Halicephalobus sp. NKZ332]